MYEYRGGKSRGGGVGWEVGSALCTALCVKLISKENFLSSTGNSTQCSVVTSRGDICIYRAGSLCCATETNTF